MIQKIEVASYYFRQRNKTNDSTIIFRPKIVFKNLHEANQKHELSFIVYDEWHKNCDCLLHLLTALCDNNLDQTQVSTYPITQNQN